MTNGTSQALYIIVAIVIFGTFVMISYLLFQDSLKPKLTAIFDTSLDNAESNLKNEKELKGSLKIETTKNGMLLPYSKFIAENLDEAIKNKGFIFYTHEGGGYSPSGSYPELNFTLEKTEHTSQDFAALFPIFVDNQEVDDVLNFLKSSEFINALNEKQQKNGEAKFELNVSESTGDFSNLSEKDISKVIYNGHVVENPTIKKYDVVGKRFKIGIQLDKNYNDIYNYSFVTTTSETLGYYSSVSTEVSPDNYVKKHFKTYTENKTIKDIQKLHNIENIYNKPVKNGEYSMTMKNKVSYVSKNPLTISVHFKNGYVLTENIYFGIQFVIDGIDTSYLED